MENTSKQNDMLNEVAFQVTDRKIICPKCKNDDCYRIPRGMLFKQVFTIIPVRRYFCGRCINRFYKFS